MRLLSKAGYIIVSDEKALTDNNGNVLSFSTKEEAQLYIETNNISGIVK